MAAVLPDLVPKGLDHAVDLNPGLALGLIRLGDGGAEQRLPIGIEGLRRVPQVEARDVAGGGVLEVVLLPQPLERSELGRPLLDDPHDLVEAEPGPEADEQYEGRLMHGVSPRWIGVVSDIR